MMVTLQVASVSVGRAWPCMRWGLLPVRHNNCSHAAISGRSLLYPIRWPLNMYTLYAYSPCHVWHMLKARIATEQHCNSSNLYLASLHLTQVNVRPAVVHSST